MRGFLGVLLGLAAASAAAAPVRWLDAAAWARPRDGAYVRTLAPVAETVRAYLQAPHARIVIRYPSGEEGILWAEELRAWLVALGVPSAQVETLPGSGRDDALALSVEPRP
ncbi:hypothetical protein [Inmirania thermothiophila]|nr:hypothetical protein [Inmirania thermothiophila]